MVQQEKRLFRRFEDALAIEVLPGITRRVTAVGERMMIVHWTLEAGTTIPLHSHDHEQIGTVISGRIRMTIGETSEEICTAGTWFVPSTVPHGATALERSLLIDVFSPPRDDYLPK